MYEVDGNLAERKYRIFQQNCASSNNERMNDFFSSFHPKKVIILNTRLLQHIQR